MGAGFSGPRNRSTRVTDLLLLGGAEAGVLTFLPRVQNGALIIMAPFISLAALELADTQDRGVTPLLSEGLGAGAFGGVVLVSMLANNQPAQNALIGGLTVAAVSFGLLTFGRFVGSQVG